MKVLEVTGTSYPTAVELPCKRERPAGGKNKSAATGNAGSRKKKMGTPPSVAMRKEAQEATEANKMVKMVIGGKSRFVRLADYEASRAA